MSDISFSVIIPAAGVGKRTGQTTPKQWLDLKGEPMVVKALRRFVGINSIAKVAIALHEDELEERKKELLKYKLDLDLVFCSGGKRRQDTVYNALNALDVDDKEIIVIHDAARPFVSSELIMSVVQKAFEGQAAIAAVPVKDTIKEVDRVGFVLNTPKRSFLWRAQTPQAVRAGILRRGLSLAANRDIELTDDAIAAELMGFRVAVVVGEEKNFKITTALDLDVARMLMEKGELEV